jgi:hypothetical protein
MSEQPVKIGSIVLIGTYKYGLAEAKVLQIANHPRYDAQCVQVEYSTVFGMRAKWIEVSDLKGILPEVQP